MVKQVDPSLVWGPAFGKSTLPKSLVGVDEFKPWTKSEDLPGRSYKTTNKISHPPLHPYFNFVETKPVTLGKDKLLRDYRYRDIQFKTTYQEAHQLKFNEADIISKTPTPHAIPFHLLVPWAEKMKTMPPKAQPNNLSEMKDSYKLLLNRGKGCGVLNDLRAKLLCQLPDTMKQAQTKWGLEESSIIKVLDPYITTSQADFTYISTDLASKYRHVKAEPEELIAIRKFPIYDENFLRLKFMDRFIREKIPVVPHCGMTTDYRDNYRMPVDELSHKTHGVVFPFKQRPLTKGEVTAVPAMYTTDYSHLGQDWAITSVL